ncbi:MAG: hypothetical protein WA887_08185, partial [Carnobacterium jeotgali]|uniref:hypothetical protein n=1 Tax=Carnobacterium jeotgali TaxID=545534 RepID=UPI003C7895E2
FKVLQLNRFFGIHGAGEIENNSETWGELYANEDFEALKEEFKKQEKKYYSKEKSINSWERALYQGLYKLVDNYSNSHKESLLI